MLMPRKVPISKIHSICPYSPHSWASIFKPIFRYVPPVLPDILAKSCNTFVNDPFLPGGGVAFSHEFKLSFNVQESVKGVEVNFEEGKYHLMRCLLQMRPLCVC